MSAFCGCFFLLLDVFDELKFLILIWFNKHVFFVVTVLWVPFKNILPIPRYISPIFSSNNFIVLCFAFRSSIHLEFIYFFIQDEVMGIKIHFFPQINIRSIWYHLWIRSHFLLLHYCVMFVIKKLWLNIWESISRLYSVPWIPPFIFGLIPHCLN